jgi:pyruvate formate lyase activating enzyme
VCKNGAIPDGKVSIDRTRCDNCGACVDACPARALEMFGDYKDVDEVIKVVEEDSNFYSRSGGGITIGGGEPLSQAEYVKRLLEKARSRGIDTAIETCGYCDWRDMEMVCRHVNQIFYDIKSMDSEKHKRRTGVSNRLILENFRKLCEAFPRVPMVVRTPVIPDFNDSVEDIRAIVAYLDTIPGSARYELLPYHRLGEPKYYRIGKLYRLSHIKPLEKDHLDVLNRVAGAVGC